MKASIFAAIIYVSPQQIPAEYPAPPRLYDPDIGVQDFRDAVAQAEFAEKLGFDWVSLSEHHYSSETLSPTPIVPAAFLAARLRRTTIAMLGPHMPLNNPVRVAEELAMLDNLAEGRLVVGLLRGTPNEYQVYGVNPAETRERTIEGMELVLRAWTEPEPFSWEGRYFQYRSVSVWPRPFQQPHPPVYVLGASRESAEFAARHRLGLGVSFGPFEVVARSTAYYRDQCRLAGWEPTPDHIIYRGRIHVGETDAAAQEEYETYWYGHRPRSPFPVRPSISAAVAALDPNPLRTGRPPGNGAGGDGPPAGGFGVPNFFGSPDTVTDQLRCCREVVGAGVVDLFFQGPGLEQERVLRSLELFGTKVLPRIREF